MHQPKVSTTQKHSDSQGEHIVHEGKLILIKQKLIDSHIPNIPFNKAVIQNYHPIIISETEEYFEDDYVYNPHSLMKYVEGKWSKLVKASDCPFLFPFTYNHLGKFKVLSLPEHFSDKHLQAIADGKMKEGKILIKCEKKVVGHELETSIEKRFPIVEKVIHLNQQNHITLFPAEKSLEKAIEPEVRGKPEYVNIFDDDGRFPAKQSLKQAAEDYAARHHEHDVQSTYIYQVKAFLAGAEQVKKNNY